MKKDKTKIVLVTFLLGIFMGSLDSGIVSPARTVIQNSFGVSNEAGTWIITLYTLMYAVSMPIIGKLADKYGYRRIYTIGITLFGLGSFMCGISDFVGSFQLLLVGRAIEAVGAGGIIPIANAFVGKTFPVEKRGTALGFIGAIYGIGTILGPTLGSGVLDLAGAHNWGWLFFINVPISIIIVLLSLSIKESKAETTQEMDFSGALVLAIMISSLMYAITNMNLFKFKETLESTKVYPFLIIFVVLIPIFVYMEKRKSNPVVNTNYFKNSQILIILVMALIVGIGMMTMVYIPQFGVNVLKLKAGSGGYLITILAVFSGVASPISGKVTDKKGPKITLIMGFLFTIAGNLVLGLLAAKTLSKVALCIGLALLGFGVGFSMGAPLNYLILEKVPENQEASGLATLSLVRSIGTAIAPGMMIGFIANAGQNAQNSLMNLVNTHLASVMPKGMSMGNMMHGSAAASKAFMPLQSANVTNVVEVLKHALEQLVPAQMQPMIDNTLNAMKTTLETTFQSVMNQGYKELFIASAVLAVLGLIVTIFLKDTRMISANKAK